MEECVKCKKFYKNLKLHNTKIHKTDDLMKMMADMQSELVGLKAAMAPSAPTPPPPPPPPPSYAAVAALPPAPEAPTSPPGYLTQFPIFPPHGPLSPEKLIDRIMRLMTDNDAWIPLRLAYQSHPEDFKIVGDKHTDPDGNNIHYTVSWKTGKNKHDKETFRTIHIYGRDRFYKFQATHATLQAYKDVILDLGKFVFRDLGALKIQDNNSTGSD